MMTSVLPKFSEIKCHPLKVDRHTSKLSFASLKIIGALLGAVIAKGELTKIFANRIRCQDARRINASCALNDPLMLVPTADGTYPENFPASLAELFKLPNDQVDSLLMAYGLPTHGHFDAKVRRLKAHIGFQ